jgi:hypothetical protein
MFVVFCIEVSLNIGIGGVMSCINLTDALPAAKRSVTVDERKHNCYCKYCLEVSIIEKHFTLNNNGGGPDDSFSLEPSENRHFAVMHARPALGVVDQNRKSSEHGSLLHRWSRYFVKKMHAGEMISADWVRIIRPGFDLPQNFLKQRRSYEPGSEQGNGRKMEFNK